MRLLKVSKDMIICIESCYISELQINEFYIKGWAFSTKSKDPLNIEVLEMETDNTKVLQCKRQDVFKSYHMYEGALNSGFTIIIRNIESKEKIKIKFKDKINKKNKTQTINVKQFLKEKEGLNNNQSKDFKRKDTIIKQQNTTKKLLFNKIENPLVSIVIPVYNQWNYTYSCLQSILENTKNIPYEVIVADDASTDETVNIFDYVENIKVIRNKKNLGGLLNDNNAGKHAKGKYIQFLNNDTKVQKDWLRYLVELIESDENIGMVGSKFIYGDGKLQEAGGIIWKDASGCRYGKLDVPEKPEYNYVKEVDYISGASIMISKELWENIGRFDERFVPAYYQDTDLAFEVRKHGYKVMYQPKSVVIHYKGVSYGLDEKEVRIERNKKNKHEFLKKWSEILVEEHFSKGENVFLARDRSRNKKTILVIDHYVPNNDKDTESTIIYQYLKLFIEKGFNVKFIYDNYYRHGPYTSHLQALGIEVLYGDWYGKNYEKWIKDNAKYIDYVFLNRPNTSIKYIDFIKKNTNAKIIYYWDDIEGDIN